MSKRRKIEPFEWWVYSDNFNSRQIEKYNVLKYMSEDIKKMKKKSATKQDFAERLKNKLMWQYWARAEYELVVYITDNRVYLKPWCGCSEDNLRRIDVTEDTLLNWKDFADYHIDKQIYKDAAKIDIWNQIEFRWNEFVDYCWTYRHKYERVKKTEESTVVSLPNDTIAKGMIKYLNEHLPPVEEPKNKFEELCFRFNVQCQSSDTDKSRVINLFTKILSEDCYTEFIDVINENYKVVEVDEWADK